MKINLNEELNDYNKPIIADKITDILYYLQYIIIPKYNKYKSLLGDGIYKGII
jgi:hypothetical protein